MSGAVIPEYGTLQLAKVKAATVDGVATVLVPIPGTPGSTSRLLDGGVGWFETPHADDYLEVYVTDEDNILGLGAGAVVGSYTEGGLPEVNRGWFIPIHEKQVQIHAIAGYGRAPAGLYLKIIATKGDLSADTFRANINWGTQD